MQTTIRVHSGRLIVAINTRETFIGLSIERVKHVCTRSREFSRYSTSAWSCKRNIQDKEIINEDDVVAVRRNTSSI